MIGNRIFQRRRRVASRWVEAYRELPVATVSDAMGRMFAGGAKLRPAHNGGKLCGPAFTVRVRPGDNLLLHKALDTAEAGDVILVDGGGETSNALLGEMMSAYAAQRGLAGVVIWGAVRDSAEIAASNFPVFAAGVTHRGPFKSGPGEINAQIAIDGMVITPGDLVIGDADGLICVPFDNVEAVHKAAHKKHMAETRQLEMIREGRNDRSWVDKALEAAGVTYE